MTMNISSTFYFKSLGQGVELPKAPGNLQCSGSSPTYNLTRRDQPESWVEPDSVTDKTSASDGKGGMRP